MRLISFERDRGFMRGILPKWRLNGALEYAREAAHSARVEFATSFWAERDRWPLWFPVFLATGIAIYFELDQEPGWVPAAASLLLSGGFAALVIATRSRWQDRRPETGQILIVLCLIAVALSLGFSAAKWRTKGVAAPVIAREIGPVNVQGVILSAARRPSDSWRLVIKPEKIEGLAREDLPERIRVTARQKNVQVEPGQRVSVRAVLMPPPGPAAPGDFDFARQAWFQRIGAVGYTVSKPKILGVADGFSLIQRLSLWTAKTRLAISERIKAALPGPSGAIAAALMTGDRQAIPEDVTEAFRIAGLAHVLAISGMHMALVGGLLFAATRLLLAGIEPLALRYPIKKWAACVGLSGAFAYLIVSGASISTQRAFIMITLMFVAVFLDRHALSMRMVAAAATLILLISPESLLHVSFQMSFAAVVGLIAFYEWWRDSLSNHDAVRMRHQPRYRWLRRGVLYPLGIAVTTIVAEISIGPFTAFHFNRLAAYGLVGNMLAMPFVGTIVMPSAVVTFLLMPFNLESWSLAPMGWGIDKVIEISQWVSSWNGAEYRIRAWSLSALLTMVIGGLWLSFWRRKWRRLGAVIIVLGIVSGLFKDLPDVLIDREGQNIAVRNDVSGLVLMSPRRARFATDIWYQRDGAAPITDRSVSEAMFRCDVLGCVATASDGSVIAYVQDPRAFEEDCQIADLIVSDERLPQRLRVSCRQSAVVIDWLDLRREGAFAVWFEKTGIRVESALQHRGYRPWTQRQTRTDRDPPKDPDIRLSASD